MKFSLSMICIIFLLGTSPMIYAETVVASRNIRAKTKLQQADLAMLNETIPGAISSASDALGLETRVTLYEGRPIRSSDLREPAIIERNQIVPLLFSKGVLAIGTEGRSLERASAGDTIRIMNLSSRSVVFGTVDENGRVFVVSKDHTLRGR